MDVCLFFLGTSLGVELLSVCQMFNLTKNCSTFYQKDCTIGHLSKQCMRWQFCPHKHPPLGRSISHCLWRKGSGNVLVAGNTVLRAFTHSSPNPSPVCRDKINETHSLHYRVCVQSIFAVVHLRDLHFFFYHSFLELTTVYSYIPYIIPIL
jgi:hypothetical protein